MTKQFTQDEAVEFYNGKEWNGWTDAEIVAFQMEQALLCVPFDRFSKAVSNVIGRPVYTHEFANPDSLRDEIAGRIPKATLTDVLMKIPPHLRGNTTIIKID